MTETRPTVSNGRPRGGWTLARVGALLAATLLLSPVNPLLLIALPLAVILVAFRPGRVLSTFLAGVLVWLAFVSDGRSTPLWYGERAWALMVGGGFVLSTLVWPRVGLAVRSIAAVAAAFAALGLWGLVRPGSVAELDWWMASELRWTSHVIMGWLTDAEADSFLGTMATTLGDMVELQIALYPALLALATLAALGVAWFIALRLTGAEGAVGPLREFGFSDFLIWVLIGGLALFLLPTGELVSRIGGNALTFMGGLYVLRGAAILAWFIPAVAFPVWSTLLLALAALLLYPLTVGLALILGISDTWLDLRARFSGSERTYDSR